MEAGHVETYNRLKLLYQASLAIGSSLSAEKSCTQFLVQFQKLIDSKKVWILSDLDSDAQFSFSYPKKGDSFILNTSELKKVKNDKYLPLSVQKDKKGLVLFKSSGVHIAFDTKNSQWVNDEEIKILLQSFCLHVHSCLMHQSSLKEVVQKEEAENKLFERESLFRLGANSLSEGIIATDLDDRITYVNRAMSDITGFSAEEMYGSIAHKLFKPVGFHDFVKEVIDKKRKKNINEQYEVEQIKKDGEHYWVRITASPFKDRSGGIIGTIATMLDISKDLKSQNEIKSTKEELQELVDTMYDGLIVLNDKGLIIDANTSGLNLFELEKEAIGKTNLEELVHPDERASIITNRDVVKKDGHLSNFVSKILTPSGQTKIVEVSSSAIVENGLYLGSRDIIRDISEKVKVREEIEAKSHQLQDLIENMYDAFIVIRKDGTIDSLNKAGEELLGYKKENIDQVDLAKLVHPDDRERSAEYLKKLETEGFYSGYEGRIIVADGTVKEVEVSSTAIYEDNKIIGSRDIVRDISERKELERQREYSEQKLRLIINTALDAVVSMDQRGNITEWNTNAESIFGYTREEVLGNRLSDFIIPHKYREAHAAGMKKYFKTGEGTVLNQRIEISAINKEGHEFPIELAISPAKQGDKTFFSAFIRDITNRKEAEAQKEALLGELEVVNQELRDFAYVVSHDLKAPLRSIGSLSDWLSQDYSSVLDDNGKELLRLLKTRVGRMHNLIEGVLQYSKIGRLQDDKEKVDINQLLVETLDLLDPPKSCSIHVDSNLPTVKYDKIRLQQVFQNLLSNAIKFLDKPKGKIEVLYAADDSFHNFTVKDNGPGIEETHFKKIFQIFQTLKAKDEYESTGIGLSIVKRIVELNGGSIGVDSKVGTGTQFTFTIPKN